MRPPRTVGLRPTMAAALATTLIGACLGSALPAWAETVAAAERPPTILSSNYQVSAGGSAWAPANTCTVALWLEDKTADATAVGSYRLIDHISGRTLRTLPGGDLDEFGQVRITGAPCPANPAAGTARWRVDSYAKPAGAASGTRLHQGAVFTVPSIPAIEAPPIQVLTHSASGALNSSTAQSLAISRVAVNRPTYLRFGSAWPNDIRFRTMVGVLPAGVKPSKSAAGVTLIDHDGAAPLHSFTVPAKYAGQRLYVSLIAHRTGSTNYIRSWSNSGQGTVISLLPQPSSWVLNAGKRVGKPKVGKRVTVSAPAYNKAGKAAGIKAQYQWMLDGREIKGATGPSLKLKAKTTVWSSATRSSTRKLATKGRKLSVTIKFSAPQHLSRSVSTHFGTVKKASRR